MTDLVFVDTNVLLYDQDAADDAKQKRASAWLASLWHDKRGRISYQVLAEFYVNATAKLRPALAMEDARKIVRSFEAWRPVAIESRVMTRAWRLQDGHRLSWWDALIVAAAQEVDAKFLLSECLGHGDRYGGVRVVSPFRVEPTSIQ